MKVSSEQTKRIWGSGDERQQLALDPLRKSKRCQSIHVAETCEAAKPPGGSRT